MKIENLYDCAVSANDIMQSRDWNVAVEFFHDLNGIETNELEENHWLTPDDTRTGSVLRILADEFKFEPEDWLAACRVVYATAEDKPLNFKEHFDAVIDTHFLQIVAMAMLMKAENSEGLISYFKSGEDMAKGKRTQMRFGAFVQKLLPYVTQSQLTEVVEAFVQMTTKDELEIFDHDFDLWEQAYTEVRSCMSKDSYGVGSHKTWRCYLTKLYGLPDNNLRLAVLKKAGKILGRAIVDVKCKTFVRCYGYHTMQALLITNGYEPSPNYARGTILAVDIKSRRTSRAYHPYVDTQQDFELRTDSNGKRYWIVPEFTTYPLSRTTGFYQL